MTLHALDKNYRIKEIPIVYRDRPNGSTSKLSTLGDGIKVVKTIVKMFKDYKPLTFFTTIAVLLFVIGLLVGIPVIAEFVKNQLYYQSTILYFSNRNCTSFCYYWSMWSSIRHCCKTK